MRLPDLKPDSETALTPERVNEHIEAAFEIATYLRRNVVQGKRTAEGNYGKASFCLLLSRVLLTRMLNVLYDI